MMKNLFLILLKIYQLFVPKRFRRKCLFKESCSNYVFRITKENGFNTGIDALKFRIRNCNRNYSIVENKSSFLLITAQYEVIEEEFISEQIIKNEKENLIK